MTCRLSFIIPCYKSSHTIGGVLDEINDSMEELGERSYEIIMINDGSKDDTYAVIDSLCASDSRYIGIDLAKNVGQHGALMAGLRASQGEIVICLDDDGQTPASEAGELIRAIGDGADVAYARYVNKRHSLFRNFGSRINEKMAYILLSKPKELYVSSYFAMKRFVVDEIVRYDNPYPYIIGLVLRATDNIVNVDINHRAREAGSSGYNLGKLVGLWLNGFTSFSVIPLRLATVTGFLFSIIGFLYAIYTIIKKILIPEVPLGFSALMIAILMVGGVTMLMLGMVGEYLGRMYICTNKSPQYVIRNKVGSESLHKGE